MPAIVFVQSFTYDWNISADGLSYDFLAYMSRPEAFRPEHHENDEYAAYLDYMGNTEKSDGVFDLEHDMLTLDDVQKVRAAEMSARFHGSPKYLGVISFENSFLQENGIMQNDVLDSRKLKAYARLAIAEYIKASHKLFPNNVTWQAAIHTNTDNVHIHFQLFEKQYVDRSNLRDKDMLPLASFEALKSTMANLICPQDERLKRITDLSREIARPNLSAAFTNTDGRLIDLYKQISTSKKPRKWQYGSYKRVDKDGMKQKIDEAVMNIIESDESLKASYQSFLDEIAEYEKHTIMLYGKRKDIPRRELAYAHNKREDFLTDAGNTLLQYLQAMDLPVKQSDDESKDGKAYLSGEKNSVSDTGEESTKNSPVRSIDANNTNNSLSKTFVSAKSGGAHLSGKKPAFRLCFHV